MQNRESTQNIKIIFMELMQDNQEKNKRTRKLEDKPLRIST